MVVKMGYCVADLMYYHFLRPSLGLDYGLHPLTVDADVLELAKYVKNNKIILVYVEHGSTNVDSSIFVTAKNGVAIAVDNHLTNAPIEIDGSPVVIKNLIVVEVHEDYLYVIDYDSFSSDFDDGIDSHRRTQLTELRRIGKEKTGVPTSEEKKNVELKLQKVGVDQKSNTILYIVANTCTSRDYMSNVIGVCFVGQDVTTEKIVMDKFIRMEGDYNTIVQSLNPLIPPLFASDENACCSEWNAAMETLTGHMKHEVLEKVLPGDVFGGLCRLKDEDTLTKFMIFLYRAINGHDASDLPFGFFGKDGNLVEVHLTANKRVGEGGKVVGCFCFLQTSEQWSLNDRKRDGATLKRNDLAFGAGGKEEKEEEESGEDFDKCQCGCGLCLTKMDIGMFAESGQHPLLG
ncbi:GAF domain-containing protein [Artemisia annua]|uniref:GAF domain-containing protein n=1 Tax=Artemisia annua TaxID=35608 RepID=A0A2U1PJ82_ARTAN|nr:GAF domain-containing protein [Artemisia annua]